MVFMSATPIISKSLSDTHNLAETFLESCTPQSTALVVALSGNLGSGKTAFVKEIAGILGVEKNEVTSPTYVIEKIYQIKHSHFTHLIHIDAYRLEKEQELISLGWHNIASDPHNLIFIEWPEKVPSLIPNNTRTIHFDFIDEATREITVK